MDFPRLVWRQSVARALPPVRISRPSSPAERLVQELAARLGSPESAMSPRRAKSAPPQEWIDAIDARIAEHDRQLIDHGQRLSTVEQRCAAVDARISDYAYELDMLTRISLRSARRLDELARTTPENNEQR